GVILVDFGTFLFSLVVLLLTRIPELKASTSVSPEKKHLLREAAFGWRYITARSGLSGLLVFFAIANLVMGGASVLITPLLLTFTTTETLGTVMSIGGSGYLAGAVAMSTW